MTTRSIYAKQEEAGWGRCDCIAVHVVFVVPAQCPRDCRQRRQITCSIKGECPHQTRLACGEQLPYVIPLEAKLAQDRVRDALDLPGPGITIIALAKRGRCRLGEIKRTT